MKSTFCAEPGQAVENEIEAEDTCPFNKYDENKNTVKNNSVFPNCKNNCGLRTSE